VTDVLFLVSRPEAAPILAPLMRACGRRGARWACFFTGLGVKAAADPAVCKLLLRAERAVICEHSWRRFMEDAPCPAEFGSQTENSALAQDAARIVSL